MRPIECAGPAGRNSGFIIDLPHEVSAEGLSGASAARSRRGHRDLPSNGETMRPPFCITC
ncbi:hypothetical protein CK215_20540 [Mesorhizobium sp. WSM3864]|nr:hypothetical protein CK215_20540 [Mesorhizobium sp. WSM3864]